MKKITVTIVALLLVCSGNVKSQNMENFSKVSTESCSHDSMPNRSKICAVSEHLTVKEQKIAAMSADAARSNMTALDGDINAALDAGLTVNEAKEIFCQLYAYCGFPKSLNALSTLQNVLKTRAEKGIKDAEGRLPSALPAGKSVDFGTENQTKLCGAPVKGALFDFAPAIDYYLKAHLFGDIFGRDNLDWRTRELATIAALAAMPGVESQLNAHIGVGKHNGLTDAQVADILNIARADFSVWPKGELNTAYAKYFIGNSYLAPMEAQNGGPVNVTFEPRCRNNWHIHHNCVQVLICVSGRGWYQEEGKEAVEMTTGSVIVIPEGAKHWHGAAKDSWFQHLTYTTKVGENASNEWLEPVSDEAYDKLK